MATKTARQSHRHVDVGLKKKTAHKDPGIQWFHKRDVQPDHWGKSWPMGWNIEYAEVGWLKNMPTSLTTRKTEVVDAILVGCCSIWFAHIQDCWPRVTCWLQINPTPHSSWKQYTQLGQNQFGEYPEFQVHESVLTRLQKETKEPNHDHQKWSFWNRSNDNNIQHRIAQIYEQQL